MAIAGVAVVHFATRGPERRFQAQRRFIANVCHELRAPLARQRAAAEVALYDPTPTIGSLRAAHRKVVATSVRQQRVIEGLLALAGVEPARFEPCDLASLIDPRLPRHDVALGTSLESAPILDDPRLLERLVANLVDNALRYTVDGGFVQVTTGVRNGRSLLCVSNTGPAASTHNTGLGLSIVQAVADAHRAIVTIRARANGGFVVEVSFTPYSTPASAPRRSAAATRRTPPA